MKTLVIIPSRLSATRLPGKPLLKINGISIISHVFKRAESANIGEVIVAAEDQEIVDDVKKNGGNAILTHKNHKTGTDRIFEAFSILDIKNLNYKMMKNNTKFGTLAAQILDPKMYENENIVKVKTKEPLKENQFPHADNFLRKTKDKINIYHHIGIYCYGVETLKKIISLKQSKNEIINRLEQLRALENNISINVGLAKSSPIGIDTEEDYLAIKKIMEYK